MDWLWGRGNKGAGRTGGADDGGGLSSAGGAALSSGPGQSAGVGGGGEGSSAMMGRRYVVDLCSRYLDAVSSLHHAQATALLKDKRNLALGVPWSALLTPLGTLAMAESSYYSLSFLEPRALKKEVLGPCGDGHAKLTIITLTIALWNTAIRH